MSDMPPAAMTADRDQSWGGWRWRWWGLIAGLLGGAVDTALMSRLGIELTIHGWDARAAVALYFGGSFAVLGYLLGYLHESRRGERRTAAQLQAQTAAVAAARARVAQSEKLAALGQLAATIAHEVRNPLAVMRSAAQTLDEILPDEGDDARRASGFIVTEIDRLSSVVDSILAYARPLQLSLRAVSAADLFDRALLLARDDLERRGAHVQRDAAVGVPLVHADPDLISQVLLGLLGNAAEAIAPGGTISLAAGAAGASVFLAVADSGPGVAPELRQRIFEPFFTTRARGTGLGLAIARQIVEAHGGRLDVGDAPGGGARFAITLPAAAAALAA